MRTWDEQWLATTKNRAVYPSAFYQIPAPVSAGNTVPETGASKIKKQKTP